MVRLQLQSAAHDELTLPDRRDAADLGGLPLVFQTLGAARVLLGNDRIVQHAPRNRAGEGLSGRHAETDWY